MKFTEKVKVPATTRTVTLRVDCDFCGDTIESLDAAPEQYRTDRVTIARSVMALTGKPCGFDYSVDMCSVCFVRLFVPWCESVGVGCSVVHWGE